jgi:hypothetical protein
LDKGSTPLRLGEDVPTAADLAAVAIAEVAGTCEIPERWVSSVDACRMLIPFFIAISYQCEVELPKRLTTRSLSGFVPTSIH